MDIGMQLAWEYNFEKISRLPPANPSAQPASRVEQSR